MSVGLLMADGKLRQLLCLTGDRSYALYLVHLPAFGFVLTMWRQFAGKNYVYGVASDMALIAAGLLLTAAAAEMTHRLVEIPMRARGRRISQNMQTPPSPKPALS